MKINCDLGEGFDHVDQHIMPLIDQANIACGGHTGNTASIRRCVSLAKVHATDIGAHPSYPDPTNFGRKRLDISASELYNSLHSQIEHFLAVANTLNKDASYIKPHGALYNDYHQLPQIQRVLTDIAKAFSLPLMMLAQANPKNNHDNECTDKTIAVPTTYIQEAFIDRRYTQHGQLVPRNETGAVLGERDAMNQLSTLLHGYVTTQAGTRLSISADTICIHGDNIKAIQLAEQARHRCDQPR